MNEKKFKLSEVCSITGVKPYVLRFWESEFVEIAPEEIDNGQKIYSREDIEIILKIKQLLFEEKLTVERVKRELMLELEEDVQIIEEVATQSEILSEAMEDQFSENVVLAKQKLNELISMTQSFKAKLQ